MSKKTFEKTWVAGGSRGIQTFNAPGTLTIPYGRYKGTLDGRGGTGAANTAATWNTNYNVAYPIATQPIATQPAATWNTNYNVAYPIANQPAATWNTNYNTNYNVAYPIATQPVATWSTNYNVAYPIATQPVATWNTNYNTNYNVAYPIANQPATAYTHGCHVNTFAHHHYGPPNPGYDEWHGHDYYVPCPGTPGAIDPSVHTGGGWWHQDGGPNFFSNERLQNPQAHGSSWSTNYNIAYPIATRPIANRPAATWNTNYNVVYPIANRPAATWNTNYNVAYPIATQPIATQPAATWNTNYNVAYPIATQPVATWNTNYNTNYNVAYPIATQPVATYSVGASGTPITIFGVTMPGAPGGGSTATPISPTPISYYTKPDGTTGEPDNASYPVTVPTGGQISFKIE